MTRERAKELLPVISAFAEGERLQCRLFDRVIDNQWSDFNSEFADFGNPNWEWRIRPEAKLRPFTQSEACAFRWFRCGMNGGCESPWMITPIDIAFQHCSIPFSEMMINWTCSIDGITWQKCGVEE